MGNVLVCWFNHVVGMKKHVLDKVFDKNTCINYDQKRGAKRSKKQKKSDDAEV